MPENAFLTMAKFKSFAQMNDHFVARQMNARELELERSKGKSKVAKYGKIFIDAYIGSFKEIAITAKWILDNVIPIFELLLSGKVTDIEKWANGEFDKIQKDSDAEIKAGKESPIAIIHREGRIKLNIALIASLMMAFRYIINKAIGLVNKVISPIKDTLKESAEEMPALESYITI